MSLLQLWNAGEPSDVPARPWTDRKPFVVGLYPQRGSQRDPWRLRIDGDVLSLAPPNATPVLTIDHTQASHCIQFGRNLLGRTMVHFTVVRGLREYAFPCDRGEMDFVLAWLPQKTRSETRRDIMRSGVGLILFGALLIALSQFVIWPCALPLIAAGITSLTWKRARVHAINGIVMLLVGLIHLFPWHLLGYVDSIYQTETLFIRTLIGAMMILWSVHQFSMLGPNEQLRSARRRTRDNRKAGRYDSSTLVHRLANWSVGFGLMLGVYTALALMFPIPQESNALVRNLALPPILANLDATIGASLAIACLLSATLMHQLRRPAYFEAKVAMQSMVTISILTSWGAILSYRISDPVAVFSGVLTNGVASFTHPYVWVTLVAAILVANHIFMRQLDQELELSQY